MCVVRHRLHVREALGVHHRVAISIVVVIAARPAFAVLPVVIEADVAISEIAEGGGDAIDATGLIRKRRFT